MQQNVDFDDLRTKTIPQLKEQATRLNIQFPSRIAKFQLINLIMIKQAALSAQGTSILNSQPTIINNQNFSSSPKIDPNFSVQANPKPMNTTLNVSQTPQATLKEYQEEQELSPLFPPLSTNNNKKVQIQPKTSKSPDDSNTKIPKSSSKSFKCQKQLIYAMGLMLLILAFTITSGIFFANPIYLAVAVLQMVIFAFCYITMNQDATAKAYSLASRTISYLSKECEGKATRYQIQNHFDADWYVMRTAEKALLDRHKIVIENHGSQQVWRLK